MNEISNNQNIEELIAKALQPKRELEQLSDMGEACLSDKTIKGLYDGTLSISQQQEAYRHLSNCKPCCIDVGFYFEIMRS